MIRTGKVITFPVLIRYILHDEELILIMKSCIEGRGRFGI